MPTSVWYATAHLQLTGNIPLHHPQAFADEGFAVNALCPGAGQFIVNAMLQGRAEYCNVLAVPLMRAAEGKGLKFLCSFQPTAWELWGRPGLKLADMAGKRLGVTSPMARAYLDDGLRAAGVDPASVLEGTPINLDGAGAEQMRRGAVDAAILMPPVTVMAGALGLERMANLGDWGGQPVAYGLMTTDRMLTERRDEVVRFVRALLRSVRALKADRELAMQLVRAQGVPEPFVAGTVDDALPQLDPDGHLPEATQRRWVDTAAKYIGLPGPVPLSRVFDFSVLDDAHRGL